MVEDRIRNIEDRVQSAQNLPEATKAELLDLLGAMRTELQGVKKEHLEEAESATVTTTAAPGQVGHVHGESMDDALGGLTSTVTELEAAHPRLAALANRLAVALANMGI